MPDESGSEIETLVMMPGAGVSINHGMEKAVGDGAPYLKREVPPGPMRDPTSQDPTFTPKRLCVLEAREPRMMRPKECKAREPMEREKKSSRCTWTTMTATPADCPTTRTSPTQLCCKPAIFTTPAPA